MNNGLLGEGIVCNKIHDKKMGETRPLLPKGELAPLSSDNIIRFHLKTILLRY